MKILRNDERELTGKHGGKRWIATATHVRLNRFCVQDIRVEAISEHWVHLGMMGDITFGSIGETRAGIEAKIDALISMFPERKEGLTRVALPDPAKEDRDDRLLDSGAHSFR